jgi:dihydropteroate synthase
MYHFKLDFKRPIVMGIVNVTPDSFSGDGLLSESETIKKAIHQVANFIEAGAEIIDVGGESTRPRANAEVISETEELSRVIPVIREIKLSFPNIRISVDTTKSIVAQKAMEIGAHIINDVSGLMMDPSMIDVAVTHHPHVIIMHSHQNPNVEQTELGGRYLGEDEDNIVDVVKKELERLTIMAISRGIKHQNIIIDPGIGFGKTTRQNVMLIEQLDEIKNLGFPVLLGASRKSFIGYSTNAGVGDRLGGSITANIVGVLRGADILRVHDVQETVQAIKMLDVFKEAAAFTKAA